MAQTSFAPALDAPGANTAAPADGAPAAPLRVVDGDGGGGGRHDQPILQILRFVADAGDPDAIADRAVASLGLLPEVLWAEVDGDSPPAPGRVSTELGEGRRLTLQLADPRDLAATAIVESLLGVIASMHRQGREIGRLRGEAHRDPLTGLFNRRGLDPFIEQALARAARTGEEIAVLMCDVDHFKRVNDEHGHGAGDRALKAVASAMAAVTRPSDIAARLGGDELIILLSGSNATGGMVVAERLRRALKAANGPAPGVENPTLSIGIADTQALGADRTGPAAADALLRAADEALYGAKSAGRDQWICHPTSFAPTEVIEETTTMPIDIASA